MVELVFLALVGIRGHQEQYIQWVLSKATKNKLQPTDLLTDDAISFLGERLSTPLQIEQYLTLAFEQAYRLGQKPITTEIIETILAVGLNDLEPSLMRHGYNTKALADLLNVKTTLGAFFFAWSTTARPHSRYER